MDSLAKVRYRLGASNHPGATRALKICASPLPAVACHHAEDAGSFLTLHWANSHAKKCAACGISASSLRSLRLRTRVNALESGSEGNLGSTLDEIAEENRASNNSDFATIPEALEDIKSGRMVIVLDDEDRENEGDLIMAADAMTEKDMGFMVRYGSGVVCVSIPNSTADRLELPLMVPPKDMSEPMRTAFTVSCDARTSTTGISAHERAVTCQILGDPDATAKDLVKPGHIFPLRAAEHGVLKRAGHTEASLDLARMAGRHPAGVLCELVNDDGSMQRLPELRVFAKEHGIKLITITELVRYRLRRERLVELTSEAKLPTQHGTFKAYAFRAMDGEDHIALVMGEIGDGKDVMVRVHSECLTGDVFQSRRCDCGSQLSMAMDKIAQVGRGVVVYLRGQEGRGIGLAHKIMAYNLQDQGRDTVEANEELGLPIDSREYGVGAQILLDLGVRSMKLMTNNPAKYAGLKGYGLSISERVPITPMINPDNKRYIETKREKMGHAWGEGDTWLGSTSQDEKIQQPRNHDNTPESDLDESSHGVDGCCSH